MITPTRERPFRGAPFLFGRKVAAAFALLFLCFCFAAVRLGAQEPVAQAIHVAAWNVGDCAAADPATKQRVSTHDWVATAIRDAHVEIIALTEVQDDSHKGADISLLSQALIRVGWPMPHIAVVNAKGEDDFAVFSRFPITSWSSVLELVKPNAWPRPGIFVSIDIGGGLLDLYGFHFKASGDEASEIARKAQARALSEYLKKRYASDLLTKDIILAGDFNTANPGDMGSNSSTLGILCLLEDDEPANDFLATNHRYLGDEFTFRNFYYRSVLDHILLSPSLARSFKADNIRLITAESSSGSIPVSDHRMLLLELDPQLTR